jgi:tetratricopeptide (TPR) repeat protein
VQVGDIVDGRYRLLDVLGEGAAGKVFRCEDLGRGNTFVALKLLHAKDPRWENFFRKEFEILSRLNHQNLVRVFDFGPAPDDGSWYFTQELVVGKPLLDALAGKKIDEVLGLFVEICRALEFIHGHGVLHRDLKPANILVQLHGDPGERVHVLDFGLWRELDPTPQRGARWAGTPPYLASEVLRGFGHSICADLYAVGVTLFQVITRKLPHGRGTPQELLAARKTPAPTLLQLGYGSRALSDLLERLLDEEASRRPQSAAEVAAALGQLIPNQTIAMPMAMGRARLVGRDAETAHVEKIVDAVKERRPEAPRLLVVEGKNGVGKSRFAAELKASAQLSGGRAAIGVCLEDGRWAYRPIADLVRFLAPRRTELAEGEQLVIDRLCPDLAERRVDDDRRARVDHQRFQQNAAQLLLNMAAPGVALVLIVEDVGYADASSTAVLAQLLKRSTGGVLVVVTVDPTAGQVPAELLEAAAGSVERISLGGLGLADVRKLIAALLGIPAPEHVPEPFAELLLSHSGGTPLLVEEVLALMMQRGDLKRGEMGWDLEHHRGGVVTAPSTTALRQRLARLSAPEKATLRALAVFNRPSGPKLLGAIARLDIDQVRRALATAEGQGLIRVVDAEDGRPRVVFRHPNIREALIDDLRDEGGLPAWHETCAAVLEERAQGNLAPVAETLATHLERANNAPRAVGFYALAVQHALSQFAFDDAIDLGRRGARVAQTKGVALDDVMRVDLAQGKALLLGGRTREARAFLESAIERKDAGRGSSYAALHLWLARACQKLGDITPGMAAVERALGVVGNDPLATARLLLARGELQLAAWPGKSGRDADKALQLLGKRPSVDDELAALSVRGLAAMGQGRYAEAATSAWRRVGLCQTNELRPDEISALRDFAVATALGGDRLGARTHLNNALKLAHQANHRVEEALLQQALGDQLFISGAYSEAIGRFQNAATLAAETGQSLARAECLKSIGRSYLQKGDYDRAVDHLRAAVDDFDRAASDDDVVRARSDLVQALLTKNATAEAEGVLDGARKRLRQAVPRVMAEFALAEGMTAMQRGDDNDARRSMVKAVVAARQTGDRYTLGEALVALAQLLLRTQQPRRAWRMSRRAEWIFTDLDARGQLKRMAPLLNASAGLAQAR